MALSIDLSGLRGWWNFENGYCRFFVSFDGNPNLGRWDLIDYTADILSRLDDNPVEVVGWLKQPGGYSAAMLEAYTLDHGMEYFEHLAGAFAPTGRITMMPVAKLPRDTDKKPRMTAFTIYPRDDLGTTRESTHWRVEHARTTQLAQWGQDWMYRRGGTQYYSPALGWWGEVNDPELGAAMADMLTIDAGVELRHDLGTSVRTLALGAKSMVVASTYDPKADWRTQLAAVREVLLWDPTDAVHGFIAHTRPQQLATSSYAMPVLFPHASPPKWDCQNDWTTEYVPDAYAVQLVSDTHLARAHDLTGWDLEQVAPGRHLLTSHDLEGWFDDPDRLPEVRAQARADFGDMIYGAGQ